MSAEEILKAKNIRLPEPPAPAGSYVPVLLTGSLAFLSGVLPREGSRIVFQGKAGESLNAAQASEAARLCALNALSVLRSHFGSLDAIRRIVRMTGYVQAGTAFYDIPKVMNGASDLLKEVFGENGVHARSAVGVASLPGNAACEIELTVEIK